MTGDRQDREMLRDSLVPVALAAEKPVRKQLCAAVEESTDGAPFVASERSVRSEALCS